MCFVCLVTTVSDQVLALNLSIPAYRLSHPGLQSDGLCALSAPFEQVSFGENVQMSCTILVDVGNPSSACLSLQTQLLNAMSVNGTGSFPTNVSAYGNATQFSTPDGWIGISRQITSKDMSVGIFFLRDWSLIVRLKNDGPFQKKKKILYFFLQFVLPNICRNIVTGLSIEVAYSRVGFLSNPQSKITGVLYRFADPVDIVLEVSRCNDFFSPSRTLCIYSWLFDVPSKEHNFVWVLRINAACSHMPQLFAESQQKFIREPDREVAHFFPIVHHHTKH